MFSNDRNIETIGQLIESLKHYIGLQQQYIKLDVVDKIVQLITAITIAAIIVVLLMLACIYLSFAVSYSLSSIVGNVLAFSSVGGSYLVLLFICFIFRHQWIEKPLVRFLANLLLDKKV